MQPLTTGFEPLPSGHTPRNSGAGSAAMLLEGVPIDDRQIRQLLGVVPPALANKLTVARVFGSQVVALTAEERAQILAAIEREPRRLDDDLRDLILRQTKWRRR